jgi:hypothetical protein
VPDLSLWRGPTLTWMPTDGNPYFILNDVEEREMWVELQAMTQVRALPSYVGNPLLFVGDDVSFSFCRRS